MSFRGAGIWLRLSPVFIVGLCIILLAGLTCCTINPFSKKTPFQRYLPLPAVGGSSDYFLTIPKDERIVMRLRTPLNTRSTRSGEYCEFATVHDVFLSLRHSLLLPAGTKVSGRVGKVRRGKGFLWGPRLELEIEAIFLDGEERIPFDASILRVLGGMTRRGSDLVLREGTLVEAVPNSDLHIPISAAVVAPWQPVAAAKAAKSYLNEPVDRGGFKAERRPVSVVGTGPDLG